MDRTILDQYEQGGERLAQAVRGLTPEDLTSYPIPGTWSIQQIVLHLADADLVIADRMKRVIAEEKPALLSYDESKWAARLAYHEQSIDEALTMFDLCRRQMVRVLRTLPDEAFARTGIHSERGPVTLLHLLQGAVDHLEHHLKFVHKKRALMGKEMW